MDIDSVYRLYFRDVFLFLQGLTHNDALAEALPLLDRRLRGFADAGAVMTGVETRSSSPVRIVRDDALQARVEGAPDDAPESGLYPCGEGAGYAGGIMSAAVDGVRVAEKIMEIYG